MYLGDGQATTTGWHAAVYGKARKRDSGEAVNDFHVCSLTDGFPEALVALVNPSHLNVGIQSINFFQWSDYPEEWAEMGCPMRSTAVTVDGMRYCCYVRAVKGLDRFNRTITQSAYVFVEAGVWRPEWLFYVMDTLPVPMPYEDETVFEPPAPELDRFVLPLEDADLQNAAKLLRDWLETGCVLVHEIDMETYVRALYTLLQALPHSIARELRILVGAPHADGTSHLAMALEAVAAEDPAGLAPVPARVRTFLAQVEHALTAQGPESARQMLERAMEDCDWEPGDGVFSLRNTFVAVLEESLRLGTAPRPDFTFLRDEGVHYFRRRVLRHTIVGNDPLLVGLDTAEDFVAVRPMLEGFLADSRIARALIALWDNREEFLAPALAFLSGYETLPEWVQALLHQRMEEVALSRRGLFLEPPPGASAQYRRAWERIEHQTLPSSHLLYHLRHEVIPRRQTRWLFSCASLCVAALLLAASVLIAIDHRYAWPARALYAAKVSVPNGIEDIQQSLRPDPALLDVGEQRLRNMRERYAHYADAGIARQIDAAAKDIETRRRMLAKNYVEWYGDEESIVKRVRDDKLADLEQAYAFLLRADVQALLDPQARTQVAAGSASLKLTKAFDAEYQQARIHSNDARHERAFIIVRRFMDREIRDERTALWRWASSARSRYASNYAAQQLAGIEETLKEGTLEAAERMLPVLDADAVFREGLADSTVAVRNQMVRNDVRNRRAEVDRDSARGRLIQTLNERIAAARESVRLQQWTQANSQIGRIEQDITTNETLLGADKVPRLRVAQQEVKREYDVAFEAFMFGELRRLRTETAARAYLAALPNGAHAKAATDFIAYLQALGSQQEIGVELVMMSVSGIDNKQENTNLILEVTLNGSRTVQFKGITPSKARKGTVGGSRRSIGRLVPSERVDLTFTLRRDGTFGNPVVEEKSRENCDLMNESFRDIRFELGGLKLNASLRFTGLPVDPLPR